MDKNIKKAPDGKKMETKIIRIKTDIKAGNLMNQMLQG